MSLQSIINISNSLSIDRRRLIGIQYSRNELPRISETPTYNPWKLNVGVPSSLQYSQARSILEQLDLLDRRLPEEITFSDNQNLSWMFKYQGTLTNVQRGQVTFNSFTGNEMVLNVSGIVGGSSSSVILDIGDIFQVQGYPYPFTSTTQVLKGIFSTVTVITHRPNIFWTQPTAGTDLNWGNDVIFNVFCPNMPTYTLNPGGYIGNNGTTINNALIEFSDNFTLYEYLPTA